MLLTKADISKNLFIGNLPAAMESGWSDMILVDVMPVRDYDAYARGSVNIFLYAKATDSLSRKPVKKLNDMETALDKAIRECQNANYSININFRDSGYDQNRNYYYNVTNLQITVF